MKPIDPRTWNPRIETPCSVGRQTIEALSLLVGLACTEKTPR